MPKTKVSEKEADGPESGTGLCGCFTVCNRREPVNQDLAGWSDGENFRWNDMPGSHRRINRYLMEYDNLAGDRPQPPCRLPSQDSMHERASIACTGAAIFTN